MLTIRYTDMNLDMNKEDLSLELQPAVHLVVYAPLHVEINALSLLSLIAIWRPFS